MDSKESARELEKLYEYLHGRDAERRSKALLYFEILFECSSPQTSESDRHMLAADGLPPALQEVILSEEEMRCAVAAIIKETRKRRGLRSNAFEALRFCPPAIAAPAAIAFLDSLRKDPEWHHTFEIATAFMYWTGVNSEPVDLALTKKVRQMLKRWSQSRDEGVANRARAALDDIEFDRSRRKRRK